MPTKIQNDVDCTSAIWKRNMTMIRDIVFVVLFLATIYGWIRSDTKKDTMLETHVELLSDKVNELSKHMEKTNQILMDQKELNGKIIQYMQLK